MATSLTTPDTVTFPGGEAIDRVARLYTKLTVLRLLRLAEGVREQAPEACRASGFDAAWRHASRLPPGPLQRLAGSPDLAAWLKTGEVLLQREQYRRYPRAHPWRHLRTFSRLLLAWVHHAGDDIKGCFDWPGHRAVSLLFGDAYLQPPPQAPLTPWACHWRLHEGRLCLWPRDEGSTAGSTSKRPLLHLDVRTLETESGGARLHRLPKVGNVRVDARGTPDAEAWTAAVLQQLRAVVALNPSGQLAQACIDSYLQCIVPPSLPDARPDTDTPRWLPGQAVLSTSAPSTTTGILQLALRDRLLRSLQLRPRPWLPRAPGNPERDRFLDAATAYGVAQLLASASRPAAWRRLIDTCRASQPRPSDGTRVPDWTRVDALLDTPAEQLHAQSLDLAASPFDRAAAAYTAGQFERCLDLLETAPESAHTGGGSLHGDETELLRAFALRHLGRQAESDALLFST